MGEEVDKVVGLVLGWEHEEDSREGEEDTAGMDTFGH